VFKPQQLPWPLLVHLVDLDVSDADRDWALSSCAAFRRDIAALYPSVPYDNDKLAGNPPRLGTLPYSLPNLQKLGGVCGDQAHFTSRVSKCLGVPAMKVAGAGRYGSAMAHAWCGFLTVQKGRPVLDRTVEMLDDGLSMSYEKYRDSQLLARAALKLIADKPRVSISLARQAVDKDTYNPVAWRVLTYHIAHGALSANESAKWSNRMFVDLAAHPDLTLECLPRLMAQLPESRVDERQKLYNAAMQLYAKRPDLQIRLRAMQCKELSDHGRQPQALELMLATATLNAKEGSLILPLVEQVVSTSKGFAATTPGFRLEVVKQQLAKLEEVFPSKRGNTVSPAFTQLQQLVDRL
jgi:hypothetical protein